MRACLFACAFVSHFSADSFHMLWYVIYSMLHIIASTSGGLTQEVYRLSFILPPVFYFLFLPCSKLLGAGIVSVKLLDHSCMLSICTLRVAFSCANGSVQNQGTWRVYTTAWHCIKLPSCLLAAVACSEIKIRAVCHCFNAPSP